MKEMSQRSGVSEATLRMWESRHGFPQPERLPSGHRRYSEPELERVLTVVRARGQGLSLPSAIERATREASAVPASLYALLRARHPELSPELLPRRALVCISHAIEDECATRAERPLFIGCFQEQRHYRKSEGRWRELTQTASHAVALAAFPTSRRPAGGPIELSIAPGEPLLREWAVICHSPRFSACMVGCERPGGSGGRRAFETVWTASPAVVAEVARSACDLAARTDPELADELRGWLEEASPAIGDEVQSAIALCTRMVRYAMR